MSDARVKRLEQDVRRFNRRLTAIENATAFRVMQAVAWPITAARKGLAKLRPKPVPKPIPLTPKQRIWRAIKTNDASVLLPEQGDVAHLVRCNAAPRSERVHHINAYLQHHGFEPLVMASDFRFKNLWSPWSGGERDGPLVSVIMAAHNASSTIEMAVLSVMRSTWRNIELIVVDDASTDDTYARLLSLQHQDHRIRLLQNRANVGPFVSKNRALDLATGAWITGHDADDFALPEGIERHMGMITADTAVSVGRMIRMSEDGTVSLGGPLDGARRLATVSALFRVDAMRQQLGYWDAVRYAADSEMVERARTLLGSAYQSDDALRMFCLERPDSLTRHADTGLDSTHAGRAFYRGQYRAWHGTLNGRGLYMPAAGFGRKFAAPEQMIVPPMWIDAVTLHDDRSASEV